MLEYVRSSLAIASLATLVVMSGCACCSCAETEEVAIEEAPMDSAADQDAGTTAMSDDGVRRLVTADGRWHVVYQVEPDPVPLNELFSIHVDIYADGACTIRATDVGLAVDARMPHHRHGMNRRPLLSPEDDGGTLVKGMLFHMPGRWELYFDLTVDGVTQRAQDVIMLD